MSAISANHSLVSDAFGSRCSARRVYTALAFCASKTPSHSAPLSPSDYAFQRDLRRYLFHLRPIPRLLYLWSKLTKPTVLHQPGLRAPLTRRRVPNHKTLETTRINLEKKKWNKKNKGTKKSSARRKGMCWGSSYCSHGEALAMLFIHYEWSSAPAEKGETTRLWA